LRKSLKSAKTREDQIALVEESQSVKEKYTSLKEQKSFSEDLGNEFSFMKGINTLEKFKTVIKSREYWADSWAISSLEFLLKIKIILFSEEAYDQNDMSNVILCGESGNDSYVPKEYIMASFTGDHYKLITYYDKGLLDFNDVPYDVKMLIINKCMEHLAGPYYNIPAFRDLQKEMGLEIKEKDQIEDILKNSSEKVPVFQYYSNSSDKKKPGKGVGEEIQEQDLLKFTELNKTKNWRQKLDNSWEQAFSLDGHKWKSVDHYYNASKFKINHPEFYLQFTLDEGNDIGTNVAIAKAAGSEDGKLQGKRIRPKEIKIDEEFYGPNRKGQKHMRNALEAKFSQNEDLKKMLLDTKNAELRQFKRGKEYKKATLLMELRDSLR
jgi:predicted NAD-dependent protein-ADP-ribosyltransferase YbiA (DUF1768 family)